MLQALCGRLDFLHIYGTRRMVLLTNLLSLNNVVVRTCYDNFSRSREFFVLCCEFDILVRVLLV